MRESDLQVTTSTEHQVDDTLLSAVFSRYKILPMGKKLSKHINELLTDIGKITQVSRTWIFQNLELTNHDILQDYVYEWAASPEYAQIAQPRFNHFRTSFDDPAFLSLVQSRQRGEYNVVITSRLPSSNKMRHFLESQNILSMLTIPIIVENQWWGTLGLDDCEREVIWSDKDIIFVQMTSYVIANMITNDHLVTKSRQLEIVKQNMRCSTWEFDVRRNLFTCTTEIIGSYEPTFDHSHTLTGWEFLRTVHPKDRPNLFSKIKQLVQRKTLSLRCDIRVRCATQTYCWVELSATVEEGIEFHEYVIVGVLWDITKRKNEEKRLLEATYTDPLTQVFNRRKFELILQDLVGSVKKRVSSLALLVVDVDYFKGINDSYGHIIGDELLKYLCSLTQNYLRTKPCRHYVFRIGGDEFAILLRNCSSQEATDIGQTLCDLVSGNPMMYSDQPIHFSISIGCTELDLKNPDTQRLFSQADRMLYEAKHAGRNKIISSKNSQD